MPLGFGSGAFVLVTKFRWRGSFFLYYSYTNSYTLNMGAIETIESIIRRTGVDSIRVYTRKVGITELMGFIEEQDEGTQEDIEWQLHQAKSLGSAYLMLEVGRVARRVIQ